MIVLDLGLKRDNSKYLGLGQNVFPLIKLFVQKLIPLNHNHSKKYEKCEEINHHFKQELIKKTNLSMGGMNFTTCFSLKLLEQQQPNKQLQPTPIEAIIYCCADQVVKHSKKTKIEGNITVWF